jgi:hypothetical protein
MPKQRKEVILYKEIDATIPHLPLSPEGGGEGKGEGEIER